MELKLITVQSPLDRRRKFIQFKDVSSDNLLDIRNSVVPQDMNFVVSINGGVIPTTQLNVTKVKPGDCVTFVPVLEGGDAMGWIARIAAMVAIFAIANAAGSAVSASIMAGSQATVAAAGSEFAMAAAYNTAAAMAAVAEAVTFGAIMLGGALLISAFLSPNSGVEGAGQSYDKSQTYSWEPKTLQQQGLAIPLIYGKHRSYGNVFSTYIDTGEGVSTKNSTLNMLVGHSLGPIRGFTNLLINGQAPSMYPGLTYESRFGDVYQPFVPEFNDTRTTYSIGRKVTHEESVIYQTTGSSFDGLEIVLSFPRGVFTFDAYGNVTKHKVRFSVEIRNATEGGVFRHIAKTAASTIQTERTVSYWSRGMVVIPPENEESGLGFSPFSAVDYWVEDSDMTDEEKSLDPTEHQEGDIYSNFNGVIKQWHWLATDQPMTDSALDYVNVIEAETSSFTYTLKVPGLSHGVYEIRVTKHITDYEDVRHGDQLSLSQVIEVYSDDFTYPRLAYTSLKAIASEQISGSLSMSVDVYGRIVRVYRADEVLGTDGKNYRCLSSHTSTADDRPITGANWATYWEQKGHSALALVSGSSGIAWVVDTSYSSTESWRIEYSNNPAWVVYDILTQPVLSNTQQVQVATEGTEAYTMIYECIASHTSTVDDKPGTGANWRTYWKQMFFDESYKYTAWAESTEYSSTREISRYDGYNPSYLYLSSFQEWADYCDELTLDDVTQEYERRITFNGVFDSASTMWDAVLQVCQMSYACPVWSGTSIRILVDKPRTSTQLFTMGNIVEDSFKEAFLSLNERTGELEVEYTDKDQDYSRTIMTIVDTTSNRPANKTNIQLFGVTSTSEACRLGYRYLGGNKYQIRLVDFEVDVDAIACEVGDRIDFSHDVPQWGNGGRVVSATTGTPLANATVTIDQSFTIAAGKTGADYTIKIRINAVATAESTGYKDTIVTKTLDSSMGPGSYTELTIDGYFESGTPAEFDPYVVGLTATVVKPFVVVAQRIASNQTAALTCIDYYAEVYTFGSGQTFSPVLNYSSLDRILNVTGVAAKENIYVESETGSLKRDIIVTFDVSTNAIYAGAVVHVVEITALDGSAIKAHLSTTSKSVVLKDALPSTTYVFVIQAKNASGEYSPEFVADNSNRVTLTTTSNTAFTRNNFKGRVTGLQLIDNGNPNAITFAGRDAAFKWRRTSSVDSDYDAGNEGFGAAENEPDVLFKHYLVQMYESGGVTKRGKSYITTEPLFTYTLAQNIEDGNGTPTESFVIAVDAYNIFNEKTADTAILAVSNTVPATITGLTAVAVVGGVQFYWNKNVDADFRSYYYRIKIGDGAFEDWQDTENNFVLRTLTAAEITAASSNKVVITIEVKAKDWYGQYSASAATTNTTSDTVADNLFQLVATAGSGVVGTVSSLYNGVVSGETGVTVT